MQKFRHIILFILLIILDQFTKHLVVLKLQDNPFIIIPKVFQLTYHENNGAVWGILSGKIVFLVLLTFILLSLMVIIYLKIPRESRYNAIRLILVFICAGAVGNLIDRILNGYVVDFIYFELIDFPVFNFADCFITLSSILLILLGLFYYKDEDFEFLSPKSAKTEATLHTTEEKNSEEKIEGEESIIEEESNRDENLSEEEK